MTTAQVSPSPVIFALDYPTLAQAREGARAVRGAVGMVKVGLELFVEAGPEAVTLGREADAPVFLDLKLHDIPATVERAVARAAALGARVLTVHAAGGPTMLRQAVARAQKERPDMAVAAVTVLTSMDDGDLARIGIPARAHDHVLALATMARDEGVSTFVCSPAEAHTLRSALGPTATLITPGVRLRGQGDGGVPDDQKRTATAAEAMAAGATWIVVGRPIRDAKDPRATALALADEARGARSAASGAP